MVLVTTLGGSMTSADINFKDFTKAKKRVEFKIDDDVFTAPSVLPIPVMQELVGVAESIKTTSTTADTINQIVNIFDVILIEDSAKKLHERIGSKEDPIDLEQLTDIMLWLLEVYGLRPTQRSSDSSAGLPDGVSGTPSAVGAPSAG
jgi:hypothetical protein